MKMLYVLGIFTFLTTIPLSKAQKIRWESGKDLLFLKNEKIVNLQYDYNNMSVGRFEKEEDYLKEKVEEYNKKEKGKGDKWLKNWKGDRKASFEPKFEELLSKHTEKTGIIFNQKNGAQFILILHTTKTEPGFNVGVMKKPAYCDFEIKFINSKTKEVLASGVLKNVPGSQFSGYDYDVASRVAESYAKAGKILGKHILSALK
jgi:hypothetical protein